MSTKLLEKNNKCATESTSLVGNRVEYSPLMYDYDLVELKEIGERELFPWITIITHPITYREGFIGMLTDEEANRAKEKLKAFKKRFNDDFARKHQILFGE